MATRQLRRSVAPLEIGGFQSRISLVQSSNPSLARLRESISIQMLNAPRTSREDFWTVLANEQEQISLDYDKAVQELLSLEEPLPLVQSLVNRMHDQTMRYRMGIKKKEAEIKEKEEKIKKLATLIGKYKNSITIDQKNALEEELTNLKKQVDVSHLREQDLQETVDYLRKQVKNLELSVEQKDMEAMELDADLELMGRSREGMQKEKEKMKKIMMQTEAMVSAANAERDEYAKLYETTKAVIDDLRRQFSEKITEAEALTSKAAGCEQTISALKKNHAELISEFDNIYDLYMDSYKQLAIYRETNQEMAVGIEELFKENETYEESEKLLKRKISIMKVRISANERRFKELQADYEVQEKAVDRLKNQLRSLGVVKGAQKEKLDESDSGEAPGDEGLVSQENSEAQCDELEKLAKDVQKYKQEIMKKNGVRAGPGKPTVCPPLKETQPKSEIKLPTRRSSGRIGDSANDFIQEQIRSLEKALREKEQKIADMAKDAERVYNEKKTMGETIAKSISTNSELHAKLKYQSEALKSMEQYVSELRQQLREQRAEVDTLKREKKRALSEKERLQAKINDLLELTQQYEEQLLATRRELIHKSQLLKKEKNQVEVIKAERNSQHAKWAEAKALLQDQKRVSKVEATQIQQLKEEVAARDKRLTQEQLTLKKLNAKYNSNVLHASKLEKKVDELKAEANKFDALRKNFENLKKEDDKERQAIMKRQAKYQREMAAINTMLDRRLVELGLLYEKVDLMNSMLKRGEVQYKERTEDIRLLKLEVGRLRYQNQVLQATYKNMADLRHEIYHLNRDLATERQKCHALQEELETPINFHRWRVLEGTDPEKRDLIDKVQILQKKLLKEIENRALEKERFNDLEAVYVQMKKKLVNLPGSDVFEELNNTKKALKDKTDENRIFAATLAAYEGEIQDYKYRLEKLQQQYDEMRTKFYNDKRVQDKAKMKKFEERQSASKMDVAEGKTVLGGGFRLEDSSLAV